ncbi:MAG: hypothetical protein ACYTFZ_07230 [Planctomycetota bacterium]|jgi:hypothetical protein
MLTLTRAKGCAWRALYLSWKPADNGFPRQIARIGLDPELSKPRIFGAVPVGFYRSCAGLLCVKQASFRIPAPTIPWSWVMRSGYSPAVSWLYRAVSAFYHKVNGMYKGNGWGEAVRAAVAVLREGATDKNHSPQ